MTPHAVMKARDDFEGRPPHYECGYCDARLVDSETKPDVITAGILGCGYEIEWAILDPVSCDHERFTIEEPWRSYGSGERHPRVDRKPVKADREFFDACEFCNAPEGGYHHYPCPKEQCFSCGRRLLDCGHENWIWAVGG